MVYALNPNIFTMLIFNVLVSECGKLVIRIMYFREIASSIKELLDSVNDVLKSYITTGRMMEHKRVCC